MAVDPYVPTMPEDAPRGSVKIPPAKGWRAVRPGDLGPGQPRGRLFGTPGPDAGYALTLAQRWHDELALASPETVHDAIALAAAVAMRRAAMLGRAPVAADVELALRLFGWLGDAPDDLVAWRRESATGVAEDYGRRRLLVNAIPEATLRLRPDDVAGSLPGGGWRGLLGVT